MLETAIRAARAAGRVLLEGSRHAIQVDRLEKHDIKLAMDKKAEAAILDVIRRRFPEHGILSEECGRVGPAKAEYLWVVDPLDASFNFSRGIPMWGTSIGLMRGEEEIVGVILDPLRGELFSAERGKGAFLNGRRIRVSDARTLDRAAIAYGYSADAACVRWTLKAAPLVAARASKTRELGSAILHLAYVACGRLDGFFELGLHPWDVCAGAVIVREAGGQVFVKKRPRDLLKVMATNGHIHERLRKSVKW